MTIEINVNELDIQFSEEKGFFTNADFEDYINTELSWYTPAQLLEGYTTKFVGNLTTDIENGLYNPITTCTADLGKWKIEGDYIYFDTFIEE